MGVDFVDDHSVVTEHVDPDCADDHTVHGFVGDDLVDEYGSKAARPVPYSHTLQTHWANHQMNTAKR